MKKRLYLLLALSIFLCACSNSSKNTTTSATPDTVTPTVIVQTEPTEPIQTEPAEPLHPEIYITENATITFLEARTEVIPNTNKGKLYADFNFEVTGSEATSMHFSVLMKAFQDGVEIKHFNFPGENILPGYSKTYTYEFDLHNTESPVLIQYCTWGKSKVVSEFMIDIAP